MDSNISQQLSLTGAVEVIVILKQAPPAAASVKLSASVRSLSAVRIGARSATAAAIASSTVMDLMKHFSGSEQTKDSVLALSARHSLRKGLPPVAVPKNPVRFYPNLGVMLGTCDRGGVQALSKDKRVANVMASPVLMHIRPQSVAAAQLTAKVTHGIQNLGVPKLWKDGLDGAGVLVGHLDTGIDGKHPALKDALRVYAEFDRFGQQVPGDPAPTDSGDHGTHTAGTIAGRPVGDRSIGVAPGAELASAKVIEGGNVTARVLGGMDWAVGQQVKVLNMSLGFPGFNGSFLALTQLLRARGILPVFASGNEGAGTSRSPGNYAEALSVGAVDKSKIVPDFSSSQRFSRPDDPLVPDIVAPGVDVISAKPNGGYQKMDGTSMATPHIAGLAALLFQAKPDATVNEVESAIFQSCDLGSIPAERGNRGFPDGPKAVEILTGNTLGGSATRSFTKAVKKPITKAGSAKLTRTKKTTASKKKAVKKK